MTQIAGMQEELTALQPQLVKTVAEVEQLMAQIAKDKAEVRTAQGLHQMGWDCRIGPDDRERTRSCPGW